MIGKNLNGRYELVEKIGEGGMAYVYRAKCHLLNRDVAIKILKKEFSNDENIVGKFKGEAAAAAGLCGNNIVNIYDVGSENDTNYIVMELVEGKTLKELIQEEGAINEKKAIDISIQMDNNKIEITITDRGKGFDLAKLEDPDLEKYTKEARHGGLGIYLMKTLMDEVNYIFNPGVKNQVQLTKYLRSASNA